MSGPGPGVDRDLAARMAHHAAPDRDHGVGIEAHLSFGGAVQRRQPLAAREHVPEACGTRRPLTSFKPQPSVNWLAR